MNDSLGDRSAARLGALLSRRAFGAGAAAALTTMTGSRDAGGKKKKKKKKKPTCSAEPRVTTCAETCGDVANNCGQAVDCGPCEGFVFEREWGVFGSGIGQFVDPSGIAVDAQGNVYVADTNNDRIQKFDNDGGYITKWGGSGDGDGKLSFPEGIAVNAAGDVFVADTGNDRVQKFTSAGAYAGQWNSDGTAETEFFAPKAIAVDAAGSVYLSTRTDDADYHGIRRFTSNGAFVTRIGDVRRVHDGLAISGGTIFASHYVAGGDKIERIAAGTGEVLGSIGSAGAGEGQLSVPRGLALDAAGNLYVADWGNHRVQIFDPSGAVLDGIGGFGSGAGRFNLPRGVAVDGDGNLFVLDTRNERVQKFRAAGPASRRRSGPAAGGGRRAPRDRPHGAKRRARRTGNA